MSERRRIRIGNQTSFLVLPVLLPFEYAVARGFDAFEWLPDKKESGEGWTADDIPRETRAIIRKTASERDISLSVHASIQSGPLKTKGSEVFQRDVEFAREVGAVLFNIHFDPDEGIDSFVRSITPLTEDLSQTGMKLSIENTPAAGPQDFNQLFRYLADVRFPHISSVGMSLDIGHANLCDLTRNDYLKYVDLLAPEVPIIHLHMHENYGDYDSHLPIFTGPAGKDPAGIKGLIERMKKRKFSGTIILEQWPQPRELLDRARNRILEMFGGPSGKTRSHMESMPHKGGRMEKRQGMIIYNLFPLLAGKFTEWERHLERASGMGFTWVFVNPIQTPGSSGSIYSIKDYFSLNPLLVDEKSERSPKEQVKDMTKAAGKLGLRAMVDLVINHCSIDSALIKSHPGWFAREPDGRIAHPFADENGKKVVWKDLAKFDHRNTGDREGLFRFFLDVVKFLAELGFKGFRCDAAYQISRSLWERLIRESKKKYPDLLFFAETLGTTPDLTRRTASAGFDYIFNSSKWWNFESKWLMQQYNLTREIAPSISFPESHDTVRLCKELGGNVEGLKQRYLFSAIFSAGVMMPVGFEFGFRKKLHVVKTRPSDWEETGIDLTSFIGAVNRMKAGHVIFQEDAPAEILSDQNPRVLFMWKASTHTQEESLVILNKDIRNKQHFYEKDLKECLQAGAPLLDISPEYQLDYIPKPFSYDLQPGQGIVLITSRDIVPED
jgi:starch synthase (maltosyl-transferring)